MRRSRMSLVNRGYCSYHAITELVYECTNMVCGNEGRKCFVTGLIRGQRAKDILHEVMKCCRREEPDYGSDQDNDKKGQFARWGCLSGEGRRGVFNSVV